MAEPTLVPFEDLDEEAPMGRLLGAALGQPDIPALEATLGRYAGDPNLTLLAYMRGDEALGLVGVETGASPEGTAVIHHLAISLAEGGGDVGKDMTAALAQRLDVRELGGIAHPASLPHFEACGFAVTTLESEGGQERYQCLWEQP